jgi:hypothetical protein
MRARETAWITTVMWQSVSETQSAPLDFKTYNIIQDTTPQNKNADFIVVSCETAYSTSMSLLPLDSVLTSMY